MHAPRRFTAEDAKTMTPEQIIAFWRERQIANRDARANHYTVLIDAATGEVVATIE